MRRKRPHFNGPTSLINKVRIPAADRVLVDVLADSRQVWPAAILRDALRAYLASSLIQAELTINPMAPQRADTPGAGLSAPEERTAEGTGGQKGGAVANAAE